MLASYKWYLKVEFCIYVVISLWVMLLFSISGYFLVFVLVFRFVCLYIINSNKKTSIHAATWLLQILLQLFDIFWTSPLSIFKSIHRFFMIQELHKYIWASWFLTFQSNIDHFLPTLTTKYVFKMLSMMYTSIYHILLNKSAYFPIFWNILIQISASWFL